MYFKLIASVRYQRLYQANTKLTRWLWVLNIGVQQRVKVIYLLKTLVNVSHLYLESINETSISTSIISGVLHKCLSVLHINGLVSLTCYQCSTRNSLEALLHSTYATTNNVQSISELTASCQTCLHLVEKCHPRVELNPRPWLPKSTFSSHLATMTGWHMCCVRVHQDCS